MKTYRILIIEDQEEMADALRLQLGLSKRYNFEVTLICNSLEYEKQRLFEKQFDLAILDLPLTQNSPALKELHGVLFRMQTEHRGTTVWGYSDNPELPDIVRSMQIKYTDFIAKAEYAPQDLVKKVEQHFDTYEANLVKNSVLYREFLAEREELLKHKWIESEKIGHDIGFEKGLLDWIIKHRSEWRSNRYQGQCLGGSRNEPSKAPPKGTPIKLDSAEVYPVWFGTNRKPGLKGEIFSAELDTQIHRGRVLVHVPKGHKFGETHGSLWQKVLHMDLSYGDLRIREVKVLDREGYFLAIKNAMEEAQKTGKKPQALLYIHGFNVTFRDAAIRAAQIGFDLGMAGTTAFFSWPSKGNIVSYLPDGTALEASEAAITDFLIDFSANCGAEKMHVVAHSMGNRGLLRALQRIATNAETQGKVKFGQVFLAAPDVDRSLFIELARVCPELCERATLYASNADKAVHLSSKLHGASRAGYFMPYTVCPGIDTIAVPDFNVDALGHSYFAEAEPLLYDIRDLIWHGEAPDNRIRVQKFEDGGVSLWKLRE